MGGSTKLMSSGAGGVILTTPGSIAADVTINMPTAGVNGGTLVCSDSSGNVGIGTSSPAKKLDVASKVQIDTSNAYGKILIARATDSSLQMSIQGATSAGNDNALRLENSSGTASAIDLYGNAIQFYVNSSTTERMRIDSSGNLLVGTTSSSIGGLNQKIAVDISASGSGGIGINGSSLSTQVARFAYSGTAVGSINVSSSATTYTTSSDYRLKENIQPMQNALDVVAQLNPVTYTWKRDGSDGQGFIAHELQAVVPDCVTGEKDAVDAEGKPVYQGIDTSFLVATLTKAIQEQQAQIETLTAKVAALEAK